MLAVMSFNIRNDCDSGTEAWKLRIENLVPLVKDAAPDLIGFQEVLHNQYLDLIERFPEYDYAGVGRDDGVNEGERSTIFYKKDRFELLGAGNFWLSETPDAPSFGWDAVCIRICTYTKLYDKETEKAFVFYNVHFDHIGKVAMLESAKQICATMLASDVPAFITGDFNFEETAEPYSIMTQSGLSDAKYAAEATMSHGTFHGYSPVDISEESPIDYLFFADGKFEINSYEVVINGIEGKYTSDHYPIMVKMMQL